MDGVVLAGCQEGLTGLVCYQSALQDVFTVDGFDYSLQSLSGVLEILEHFLIFLDLEQTLNPIQNLINCFLSNIMNQHLDILFKASILLPGLDNLAPSGGIDFHSFVFS